MKAVTVTGTVLGVALAVLLFFVLPTWIYNLIGGAVRLCRRIRSCALS